MSSSDDETSPLADQLTVACADGDLPSAKAAVADGASVNEKGVGWGRTPVFPLRAALARQQDDVVVWLLSHGADPNTDEVMFHGAWYSAAAMLQLLIDAGGDVNRESYEELPLFCAVLDNREDKVRVLLAQPSLDCTIACDGKTAEQYARDTGKPALADMIAQEVSGKGLPIAVAEQGTARG